VKEGQQFGATSDGIIGEPKFGFILLANQTRRSSLCRYCRSLWLVVVNQVVPLRTTHWHHGVAAERVGGEAV